MKVPFIVWLVQFSWSKGEKYKYILGLFSSCFHVTFDECFIFYCFLCWDRWNGTVMPTLDVAKLSSSRAGTDLGQLSDVESDASPG